MTKFKGTQGPFSAGISLYKGVEHFTVVAEDNQQKIVALCGLVGAADEKESIANAYLLSASRDLLDSLMAVKEWDIENNLLGIPFEIRSKMQFAIDKALGEDQ